VIRYYAPNGRALGWYLGSIVRFEVNKKKNSDFFVTDVSFLIEYRGSNQEPLSVQKGYVSVKGTPVDSETATLDVSASQATPSPSYAHSATNQSPPSSVAVVVPNPVSALVLASPRLLRRVYLAAQNSNLHQRLPCARPWALRRRWSDCTRTCSWRAAAPRLRRRRPGKQRHHRAEEYLVMEHIIHVAGVERPLGQTDAQASMSPNGLQR
jgi:hypothetical protein